MFHLELVVILAMWFYHQGALEAFTLTHGVKACCGDDWVLWRCLDTIRTQIRAYLSRTSPHTKNAPAIGARSLVVQPFMPHAPKENWLKANPSPPLFLMTSFSELLFHNNQRRADWDQWPNLLFPSASLLVFLLESGKRAHPIFPVSHRVVILGLTAVTLDWEHSRTGPF